MIITNGQIEYEHPHKVADFQIPKARVSLSFLIPEGEDVDAALYKVGDLARAHAMRIASGQDAQTKPLSAVHLKDIAEIAAATEYAPNPPGEKPNATVIPPQPGPRRGRPPKAVTAQAAPAPEPVYPDHSLPEAATPPANPSGWPDASNATAAPATSTVVPPGASPSPVSVDPSLLTDDALKKTLNAKAQAGTPVEKIKELVWKYSGNQALPIYTVKDMGKRAEFLAELKGL